MKAENLLSQFATESNIVTRKVKVGKTLYKLLLNTELTDPIAIRSVIKALELYGKDANR